MLPVSKSPYFYTYRNSAARRCARSPRTGSSHPQSAVLPVSKSPYFYTYRNLAARRCTPAPVARARLTPSPAVPPRHTHHTVVVHIHPSVFRAAALVVPLASLMTWAGRGTLSLPSVVLTRRLRRFLGWYAEHGGHACHASARLIPNWPCYQCPNSRILTPTEFWPPSAARAHTSQRRASHPADPPHLHDAGRSGRRGTRVGTPHLPFASACPNGRPRHRLVRPEHSRRLGCSLFTRVLLHTRSRREALRGGARRTRAARATHKHVSSPIGTATSGQISVYYQTENLDPRCATLRACCAVRARPGRPPAPLRATRGAGHVSEPLPAHQARPKCRYAAPRRARCQLPGVELTREAFGRANR